MHRVHARRVGRLEQATGFVRPPEPRSIGIVARGKQLIAGDFLFSGMRVQDQRRTIWDISAGNTAVSDEVQGCAWLDDLAAVGDETARLLAQRWVSEWITRYGQGSGPGWTPDLVARRLIRWINHGILLLRGQDEQTSARFFQSLARQTLFLSRRWRVTPPGLARFEALAGMICAGLSLRGMTPHVDRAVTALARDCETHIDAGGGIASRNPEDLLEVLTLLNWTVQTLTDAGRTVPPQISRAIDRVAPTLRALRHADGGLARFHGGNPGVPGRLDQALAESGVKGLAEGPLHMGFARLTGGRTTVIVDAARPPVGEDSANAHASTLGFELTSGRRPLIVNCGSGARFGDQWRRASRATPSHATLGIDGVSSSHLASAGRVVRHRELLLKVPEVVHAHPGDVPGGRKLELAHDGYRFSHGLTHVRTLSLSVDGRSLAGEDLITTLNTQDNVNFDHAIDRTELKGIGFAIRFHLHPDVEVGSDEEGTAVALRLRSGEVWFFQHDGAADISIAPSVYLQNRRLKPRPAQQVVLSGRAMSYATRVRWYLAKAQDTPTALRDFSDDDPLDSELD